MTYQGQDERGNVMFVVGDRVRNVASGTAVPVDCIGTVVEGPASAYGVTVLWDGLELREGYGGRCWRPYWPTGDLRHVDARKHAVYDPCSKCGKVAPVFVGIPGRAMGGIWVAGAEVIECKCGHRRYYRGRD